MNELLKLTELEKVLNEYAAEAVEMYKYQLSLGRKTASRKLIDSVTAVIETTTGGYEVSLNLQEYWKYIEFGRQGTISSPAKAYPGAYPPGRAAFPPVGVLLKWISVKPIIPRPGPDGKFPKPETLAYLIGRKIERFGIEPHPALKTTQEELDKIYRQRISDALGHDVYDYIRKVF